MLCNLFIDGSRMCLQFLRKMSEARGLFSGMIIFFMLAFGCPAFAQLTGTDSAPGSSCAGFPAGAARLTADADQDGKTVKLICDGTIWQPAGFRDCNTVGDTPVWTGVSWKCSSTFAPDASPNAFSFTNQTDVATTTLIMSNTVMITGVDIPVYVQASGDGNPEINIDAGGWTTSGFISSGQTLQLRLTSAAGSVETSSALLNIGTSAAEWTVTTLNTACVGGSLGGFCWHAGANSQSCDTACASFGGCNLEGTRDFAGSGGTNANCATVLSFLGLGSGSVWPSGPGNMGCFFDGFIRWRDYSTTCAGSYSSARRACACNT